MWELAGKAGRPLGSFACMPRTGSVAEHAEEHDDTLLLQPPVLQSHRWCEKPLWRSSSQWGRCLHGEVEAAKAVIGSSLDGIAIYPTAIAAHDERNRLAGCYLGQGEAWGQTWTNVAPANGRQAATLRQPLPSNATEYHLSTLPRHHSWPFCAPSTNVDADAAIHSLARAIASCTPFVLCSPCDCRAIPLRACRSLTPVPTRSPQL